MLSVTAVVLNSCGANPTGRDHFSFRHFDSLPRDKILPEAQKFVADRFPPGSDVEQAMKEFIRAGAQCGRTRERNGDPLYLCWYSHGFLVQTEWKIAIYLDKDDERKVKRIEVNRGLTGM